MGVVADRLNKAGLRAARNEANRDCVLGNAGSGVVDEGIELVAFKLDVEGEGDAVLIALRSSSKSAALSTGMSFNRVHEGEYLRRLVSAIIVGPATRVFLSSATALSRLEYGVYSADISW